MVKMIARAREQVVNKSDLGCLFGVEICISGYGLSTKAGETVE